MLLMLCIPATGRETLNSHSKLLATTTTTTNPPPPTRKLQKGVAAAAAVASLLLHNTTLLLHSFQVPLPSVGKKEGRKDVMLRTQEMMSSLLEGETGKKKVKRLVRLQLLVHLYYFMQ